MSVARPDGVKVLTLLFIIGGILFLVSAAFGGYFFEATILGLIAIISFGIAYGLWHGRRWARTATMILAIVGLVVSLMFTLILWPLGIVGIIIETTVIYYLTRPHVKNFFGKGAVAAPALRPTFPSPDEYGTIRCSNCGHVNPDNFNYCGKCGTPLTEEEETKIY